MATTSPRVALAAIQAIEDAGVHFAVLHGEPALAAGAVSSDVDIVAGLPVDQVAREVKPHWVKVGLHPVVVWPYDVGGTGSIFLATPDAGDGVQVDVLHDPLGEGRYGVRSEVLLVSVERGDRFPTINESQRVAYLLAKRLKKGQIGDARRLVEAHDLSAEVDWEVLEPQTSEMAQTFVSAGDIRPRRQTPGVGRIIGRILKPVGSWVEIRGDGAEDVAISVASRFGRFLPYAGHLPAPTFGSWVANVAPIRWRAGLVASYGKRSMLTPAPDVHIDNPESVEHACGLLVSAMAERASRHGPRP